MLVNNRKRPVLERNENEGRQSSRSRLRIKNDEWSGNEKEWVEINIETDVNVQCDDNNLLRVHVVLKGSIHSRDCVRQ